MTRSLVLLVLFLGIVSFEACNRHTAAVLPGSRSDGTVLLPNGWSLSPAGKQLALGDFPMNFDVSPDGRYAIVTNNGVSSQSAMIIDIAQWSVIQTIPLRKAWLGIRFFDEGKRFLVSGGNDDRVFVYNMQNGQATLADSVVVGKPWPKEKIWLAGLDIDEKAGRVYVAAREDSSLYVLDLRSKQVVKQIRLSDKPYTCLVSRVRNNAYVSIWGGSSIDVVDRSTLEVTKTIAVQDHPNDIVESPDGKRIFVANGNRNSVSVIDVDAGRVIETLNSAIIPDAPNGSTPNSVALSPDGSRLYIANADNNYLAVMDVSTAGTSRPLGFIPVGWYPTAVRVVPGSGEIIVANGKGGTSMANPRGPDPVHDIPDAQYIGSLFKGTLSKIDVPDAVSLEEYTARVYANTPFKGSEVANPVENNPIPSKAGDSSPIKHVFYIIKENRTYDQVFGDIAEGNGDPSLCLFPDSVSPNQHALAREFVLLDNFYVDAEVSADGHNWSMAAYATDYVEKSWPTNYGGRGGNYDFEGSPASRPTQGYIWDNCARNGVSYRSYGEFVVDGTPKDSVTPATPSLVGHVSPFSIGWDLHYSDIDRYKAWKAEFDRFEQEGGLPQFQIIRLPNDHTEGTRKGSLTPAAYVAQNDLAVGLVVDRITHSRYWKESAIFILEDDAQNGPDHVDAHRSIALVISPYTKRQAVDHTMYSTSGMIRTMELILGMPPMTQYDAAATPMYNAFTMKPMFTPYDHIPARIDIEERNLAGAYRQDRMETMDFTKEDAAPDIEFNEIIWKAVRGEHSVMPAPVRSAFVKVSSSEQMDDDD